MPKTHPCYYTLLPPCTIRHGRVFGSVAIVKFAMFATCYLLFCEEYNGQFILKTEYFPETSYPSPLVVSFCTLIPTVQSHSTKLERRF